MIGIKHDGLAIVGFMPIRKDRMLIYCDKKDIVTSEYHCYCECKECHNQQERKLDDWIKPFMDSVNERFKQCGKQ